MFVRYKAVGLCVVYLFVMSITLILILIFGMLMQLLVLLLLHLLMLLLKQRCCMHVMCGRERWSLLVFVLGVRMCLGLCLGLGLLGPLD